MIVFDDADLELAAENIAIAGYFNAGQDCTAATRVLAGPRVHDDFVAALVEQARRTSSRTSPPDDGDVLYGPLNNANQLGHVSGFVERAPDHADVRHRRPPPGRPRATSTSRRSSTACSRTTR